MGDGNDVGVAVGASGPRDWLRLLGPAAWEDWAVISARLRYESSYEFPGSPAVTRTLVTLGRWGLARRVADGHWRVRPCPFDTAPDAEAEARPRAQSHYEELAAQARASRPTLVGTTGEWRAS